MSDAAPILSADAVRKVAQLSRLAISEADVELYRAQLSAVLAYVERLGELDLTGVEPLAHPTDAFGPLGDDVPGETLPHGAVMEMAPETFPPFIKVPKVLGEGGGA